MTRSVPRPWSGPCTGRPVVVGVAPGQPPYVVDAAARLAANLGTGLVCAWVDETHVVVEREPDGALDLLPVDPDADEAAREAPDDELVAWLAGLLEPLGVPWRYVYVTGEAARGLAHVADEHAASFIVVGVRRPGLASWMNQLVGGSVGGHLAHSQARPVVLVPAPRATGAGASA